MRVQKKIAMINDFSGFGRCSLMVSVPIISAMKVQCCALPTAILSNHTGYEDFFFDDYTDRMKEYYEKWERLGLSFDGIYTGFLGAEKQVGIVQDFIRRFAKENTVIIVDPVMGDNGSRYTTIDEGFCKEMRKLLPGADIITPNLTEACLLAGDSYLETGADKTELTRLADKLRKLGAKNIVITGIADGEDICDFIYTADKEAILLRQPCSGEAHAGTGDVFSSVIAADAVNGEDIVTSVKKAAAFVGKAIKLSHEMRIPTQEGVCFEELLCELAI